MDKSSTLSRIQSRRAQEASAPPRPLWRVFGTFPILALALLVAVQASLAWFTSAGSLAAAYTSGDWVSLMDPDTIADVAHEDYAGTPYRKTFPLTSTAAVELPLLTEWENATGSAPAVTFENSQGQTVTSISAGQTVTAVLSGHTATFDGTLLIYIGAGKFDSRPVAVDVTVSIIPIDDIIEVTPVDAQCKYKTGTAAPKIDWLYALDLTRIGPERELTVSIRQASAAPTQEVYVWAETAGNPHPTHRPPLPANLFKTMTFTPPAKIWLYQGLVTNDVITYVEVTLTSTDPNVVGSHVETLAIGHADDIVKLGNVCKTPIPVFPAAVSAPVPAAPEGETPAAPEGETPAAPEEETPAAPEEETPAAPEEETPAAPEEETPAAPEEETPAAPEEETSAAEPTSPEASQ